MLLFEHNSMKRWCVSLTRKIIGVFCGLIFAPFAILALLITTINLINWDKHTEFLASAIEVFSDWDVEQLDGMTLKLQSEMVLAFEDIKMQQRSSASSLQTLEAQKIKIQIQTLPLLFKGKVMIDELYLNKVNIVLKETAVKTDQDEELDWKNMIDGLPPTFVANASINDSKVTYQAHASKNKLEAFLERLTVRSKSIESPLSMQGSGQVDGTALVIQGSLGSLANFQNLESDYPIELTLSLKDQLLTIIGHLNLEKNLHHVQIEASGSRLAPYLEIFGLEAVEGITHPYKLYANIDYSPQSLLVKQLKLELGKSHLFAHLQMIFEENVRHFLLEVPTAQVFYRDLEALLPTENGSPQEPRKLDLELDNFVMKAPGFEQAIQLNGQGSIGSLPFKLLGTLGSMKKLQDEAGSYPLDVQLVVNGETAQIKAEIAAKKGIYRADVNASGENLAPLIKILDPSFAGQKTPSYQLMIEASYHQKQLALAKLKARLGSSHIHGSADLTWNGPKSSFEFKIGSAFIDLQDVNKLLGDGNEEPNRDPIQLKLERVLIASQSRKAPINIEGRGTIQKIPFYLDGTAGSIRRFHRAAAYPIHAKLLIHQQKLDVHASLRPSKDSYQFRMTAKGEKLAPLLKALGYEAASPMDIPPYSIALGATYSRDKIKISQLKASLGKSLLSGKGEIRLKDKKPFFKADLVASQLSYQDFAGLLPAEEEKPEEKYVFSKDPLPLEVLQLVNANVNLKLGDYKGGQLGEMLDEGIVGIKLRDGLLTVDPLALHFAGGTIGGNLTINSRPKAAETKLRIGISELSLSSVVAPIIPTIAKGKIDPREIIVGRLQSAIDLKTRGNSLRQMASNLNGNLRAAVDDGHIGSTILEALGFDITETLVSWFKDHPPTPLNCSIAEFDIKDGLVKTRTFLISTRDSNIRADGYIDLKREMINMQAFARAKDFSIGSFQTPVISTGRLSDINFKVNKRSMFLRIAAAVALGTLLTPVAGLLPMVEPGLAPEGKCQQYEDELTAIRLDSRAKVKITSAIF